MGAPSLDQQDTVLALLAGVQPDGFPAPGLRRDALRVDLIRRAVRRGVTWGTIGAALGGQPPKVAKHSFKQLERRTVRAAAASRVAAGQMADPR
jgi:hypothetical protein